MIAFLMLLLFCCCVGKSTAFVCPGARTLKHSQNVQRFRVNALFAAERDDDLADLKTRTTVLETKSLAVEKSYERLECTLLQIINKMDTNFQESNAKMDRQFQETNTKMDRQFQETNAKIDRQFQESNAKMDRFEIKMDTKVDKLEIKMDTKMDKLEMKMDNKFNESNTKMDKLEKSMITKIDKLETSAQTIPVLITALVVTGGMKGLAEVLGLFK
jgi:hypothetical protein